MLRTAFKLALRQTEVLMTSVLTLMGLPLSAPDHSTVSRRAVTVPVIQPAQVPHGPLHVLIDSTGLQVYGAGQWLEAKPGGKSRRAWRKLHLAVDAASGMIVAQTLTDQDVDDPSQVGSLLDQIDNPIVQVTADGAYDGAPTYRTIARHGDGMEVVIPPRATAVLNGELDTPTQRDRHLAMIAEQGRLAWQTSTGYSRNDNGPLQDADRTAAASPRFCGTTDRSCHRRGGAQPDVSGRSPGFGPSPAGHRITAWGWGHLALPLEVHQRRCRGLNPSVFSTMSASPATIAGQIEVLDSAGRHVSREAVGNVLSLTRSRAHKNPQPVDPKR
jgi:hypothetical protein